jgi:hypothetical protein
MTLPDIAHTLAYAAATLGALVTLVTLALLRSASH